MQSGNCVTSSLEIKFAKATALQKHSSVHIGYTKSNTKFQGSSLIVSNISLDIWLFGSAAT